MRSSLSVLTTFVVLLLNFDTIAQKHPDFNEKKVRVFMDLGVGSSSIKGYSLNADFQVNWNKHNWTINGFYTSQLRKNASQPSYGGPGYTISPPDLYYNDHYSHLGIYYGRSFSRKRFHTSINVGPAYYNYLDKELETHTENWQTYYVVNERRFEGVSLSLYGDVNLFIGKTIAIGAVLYSDINKNKSLIGICGTFKFLID